MTETDTCFLSSLNAHLISTCRDICRSGSADENADDFASQQQAAAAGAGGGQSSSMETSETEADTDNILSHGGDLNALSNNRRRRRHKQASYL